MDEYTDISYVNCRRIRKEKGLSLRELSQRSGLSTVYLSNYENGKANITIASLYAIAKALDTTVNILLTPDESDDVVLVPRNRRFALAETSEDPEAVYQEFLTRGSSFDMQVTVMHLQPHTDSGGAKTHDSDEFVYILRGELVLHYGCAGKTYTLREGDFVYYSALQPHYWENMSDEPLEFLAVASRQEIGRAHV